MQHIHLTVVLVKQEDIMQHIIVVMLMVVQVILAQVMVAQEKVVQAITLTLVDLDIILEQLMLVLDTVVILIVVRVILVQIMVVQVVTRYLLTTNVHHTQCTIQRTHHILLQDTKLHLMVLQHIAHMLNPTNSMQQYIKKLVEGQFQKIHA